MEPQRIDARPRLVTTSDRKVYLFMKRLLDILIALVGIICLSPVFIIVGILIKLEDPNGPVFFTQTRVGLNEQNFIMIKFRSMVVNAEELLEQLVEQNEARGHLFKIKNDPRVLKVGKFIRKTSIDELPQLINVLKGDMSLVGPRPPLQREVNEYTAYHKKRLTVVPGCTGLWQISGRSSIGFEEMVELDLKYIQVRNFWFDFRIILKTVFLLFGSKNAY